MSPEKPSDSLAGLLRAWEVDAQLPPRFRDGVWSLIADAERRPTAWSRWHEWLTTALARPAMATAYVTALLVLGLSVGLWRAQVDDQTVKAQLSARYVQAVDPYRALHP